MKKNSCKVEEEKKTCECKKDGCTCDSQKKAEHKKHCEEKKLKAESEEIKIQSVSKEEEYLMLAKSIQAEFENFRKRTIAESKILRENGMLAACDALFPVLDTVKKAKTMVNDENSLKGLKMIEEEIENAFTKIGLTKIETENAIFDANTMNAIAAIPFENKKDGEVVQQLSQGFKFGERVVKFAQVVIAKA